LLARGQRQQAERQLQLDGPAPLTRDFVCVRQREVEFAARDRTFELTDRPVR